MNDLKNFLLNITQHITVLQFFLEILGDGDWGWLDVNIDEDGEQFYELEVPETPDDFWFNVFSMSKENGIGLTRESYNTIRPLDFYCEAPGEVHRGESVGLRCNVLNR